MKLIKLTERRTQEPHLINPAQIVQVVPDYANNTCTIYMAGNSLANGMSFAISEQELGDILFDLPYDGGIYDFTIQRRVGEAIVDFASDFLSLDPEWNLPKPDLGQFSNDS